VASAAVSGSGAVHAPYVDTHAHLQWPTLMAESDDIVARAMESGVGRILTLGTDVATSRKAIGLAQEYGIVYAAAGIHPSDAPVDKGGRDRALAEIADLLANPRVVAVGEAGLDYYHADNPPRDAQIETFSAHLEFAAQTGKPLCIHNREATTDVMVLLDKWAGRCTPVLHCFTGDLPLAQHALDIGCYISLAGNCTYPKLKPLLDVAAELPVDRLLIETDAPFLAPLPRRGGRNESSYVVFTYAAVAQARGVAPEVLARDVALNAARVFGWPLDHLHGSAA